MKMQWLMTSLLGLGFAAQARTVLFGGNEAGNGGQVVVCKDLTGVAITSVELLDYYEGRVLRGYTYDLGEKSLGYEKKVERVLTNLTRVSPVRVATYRERAQTFMGEALVLKDIDLGPVSDAGFVILPHNCKAEQIAVQRKPQFKGDKRYYINKDLWDHLDNDGKAGLILHELIYREAIEYGQETSGSTRYLNSFWASSALGQITLVDFVQMLREAKFLKTDIYGYWTRIDSNRPSFEDGFVTSIALADPTEVTLPPNLGGTKVRSDSGGGSLTFYKSGALKRFWGFGTAQILIKGQRTNVEVDQLELYESGNLKQAALTREATGVNFSGADYELQTFSPNQSSSGSYVTLRESGELSSCSPCRGWVNTMFGRSEVQSSNGGNSGAHFYDNGKVAEFASDIVSINFKVQQQDVSFRFGFSFDETGQFTGGYMDRICEFKVGGMPLKFDRGRLSFFDPETIRSGRVFDYVTLTKVDGTPILVKARQYALFDTSGRVVSVGSDEP